MIGALYEMSLTGAASVEVEHADARRTPLRTARWFDEIEGDTSLLDRCSGPTLDVGSGPGRLTVALARRGHPTLGIDVTHRAVELTRRYGALALHRDVFARVPGAGRWHTVLLADGNIGIGGDPVALLRRVAQLIAADGRTLVEVEPRGHPTRRERIRLRSDRVQGAWFPWAYVGADGVDGLAREAGLAVSEQWTEGERWFVALAPP